MSNPLSVLNNIRTLRAQARETEFDVLTEALEKLQVVVQERREELEKQAAADKERDDKLEKYRAMLEEDGISLEELVGASAPAKAKSKREPRPAKYRYTDENGVTKTWTGQGRTPGYLARQLDSGKTLDDFLI